MSGKSIFLVCFQMATMGYLLFKSQTINNDLSIILQISGISLALWGIIILKLGNFNIQPEVKSNSLITKGPYKFIRNPMYTGTILFFIPIVIHNFNTINILVYITLIITLLMKILSEEQFLEQRFGLDYKLYKKATYRLIPFTF